MNEEQKRKLKECLLDLYTDFENQSCSLNARNDVSWSCYDVDNWNNLIDIVLEIANILEINLDIEEEIYDDNSET